MAGRMPFGIILIFAVAVAALPPLRAAAQGRTVLVELFSSQGCSACPPADKFLAELAGRDNVVALGMHVDYWDYIGWKDNFARPEFSARQRAYASARARSMVYTPEMIVNGADDVIATHPEDVSDLIDKHAAAPSPAILDVTRREGSLLVSAAARPGVGGICTVRLVRYRPEATVKIKRGENAGRTVTYTNIATTIEELAQWDMRGPLEIEAPFEGDLPGVVIVQMGRHGPVQAVARAE